MYSLHDAGWGGRQFTTCRACGEKSPAFLPGQKGAASAWRVGHAGTCTGGSGADVARRRADAQFVTAGYDSRGLGVVAIACPSCDARLDERLAPHPTTGRRDPLLAARAVLVPRLTAHLIAEHTAQDGDPR